MFEYAVKFVCGKASNRIVASGTYFTAINVHNPSNDGVKFRSKVALVGQGFGVGGTISDFEYHALDSDQAMELDCSPAGRHRMPGPSSTFGTGFLVIQSDTELDVVAVYTAQGTFGKVKSIDVEYIAPRVVEEGDRPTPDPDPDPDPKPKCELDHFQVYEVENIDRKERVDLKSEIDSGGTSARVALLTHTSVPVAKIHRYVRTGITNPSAYLNWYVIKQDQSEPPRTIRFTNQFGQQSVNTLNPEYLLLPSTDITPSVRPLPAGVDHFKCYEVTNVNVGPDAGSVILIDKFGSRTAEIGDPVFVGVPVVKSREGERPTEIENPGCNLVFYRTNTGDASDPIAIRDQFDEYKLVVGKTQLLGVPSTFQVVHEDQ